jgi:hypothetical protein
MLDGSLGFADRHPLFYDGPCDATLEGEVIGEKKSAAMPGGEFSFFDKLLDIGREFEESNGRGDERPVFANTRRHVFLRKSKRINQFTVGIRLFDRIQLLALDVFDQRQLE